MSRMIDGAVSQIKRMLRSAQTGRGPGYEVNLAGALSLLDAVVATLSAMKIAPELSVTIGENEESGYIGVHVSESPVDGSAHDLTIRISVLESEKPAVVEPAMSVARREQALAKEDLRDLDELD